MYWSERSLCDRHHSTIVKLIHAIKKCAFITQLRQQQDYLLSPLTISEMNDMRFHCHQLTRNTVDLSFLGSEPSEMILVKLLVPKCIMKNKLDNLSVQTMGKSDRFASFHIGYVNKRCISTHERSSIKPGCTFDDCEDSTIIIYKIHLSVTRHDQSSEGRRYSI